MKTDNRPVAVRNLDRADIAIGIYGADYLWVLDVYGAGKVDFVLMGVLQNGSWGVQSPSFGHHRVDELATRRCAPEAVVERRSVARERREQI